MTVDEAKQALKESKITINKFMEVVAEAAKAEVKTTNPEKEAFDWWISRNPTREPYSIARCSVDGCTGHQTDELPVNVEHVRNAYYSTLEDHDDTRTLKTLNLFNIVDEVEGSRIANHCRELFEEHLCQGAHIEAWSWIGRDKKRLVTVSFQPRETSDTDATVSAPGSSPQRNRGRGRQV